MFTVPDVEPSGESGLMDLTLHPEFARNGFVYLAYSYNKDGKQVKVVRYAYKDNKFTEDKVIVDHIPRCAKSFGYAMPLWAGRKNFMSRRAIRQIESRTKTDSFAGKTLRLNDDGTVPKDNPFVGKEGYRPEIWTIGNRNAQGLAFQPGSNLLFETEHGPSSFEGKGGGGDEVNILESRKKLWLAEIAHKETREGMISPLLEYSPACAPGSAMFYNGSIFPAFKGNFFFGCLRGREDYSRSPRWTQSCQSRGFIRGTYGRIREMVESPDGYIISQRPIATAAAHPPRKMIASCESCQKSKPDK